MKDESRRKERDDPAVRQGAEAVPGADTGYSFLLPPSSFLLPAVALVGAGPGHPGLLTLRGAELLARADLVLYDRLVPAGLLEHAPPGARRVCVDEFAPHHADRAGPVIAALIDAARQGLRVVRLKGGDPFLFGRGGEEAEALRAAAIPFEVVPGVTAALGAGACAGIPLTHRLHASAVALVTGHEQPGKGRSALDWSALAHFPGTLVFYMGLARLGDITRLLVEHGKPPETPAAVVERGSTARQRVIEAPLTEVAGAARAAGVQSPALLVVGAVVALRRELAWFEARPLFGQRVLVTRPRHQAAEMVRSLEELGAEAVVLPTVEVGPPADWGPVDRALAELDSFGWLVFTSANGVQAFVGRLRQRGRDLRALGRLKLAAIGPATAAALRGFHLDPDVVPAEFNSEGLAAALREAVRGQRVLLARADRGIELLREVLGAVAAVEQVAVYAQTDAALDAQAEGLVRLGRGGIDFVTLTSSNVARALIGALDETARARIRAGQVRLVTISPRTSAAVRELGLPVAAEAREYTTRGVLAALCERVACGPGAG
jgi:uroporphyrinogen III methyltransferase/synthase